MASDVDTCKSTRGCVYTLASGVLINKQPKTLDIPLLLTNIQCTKTIDKAPALDFFVDIQSFIPLKENVHISHPRTTTEIVIV